ncbi:MAG: hypothetical protein LUP97_01710 [Methanoregula sp.]|nr:hypothetical protein [Methanoregula sp.]
MASILLPERAVLVLILIAIIAVLPACAEVSVGSSAAAPAILSTPAPTGAVAAEKPFISATVTSLAPVVGQPVTISGVETGGNVSAGVQIWIFAGEYVNVQTVPVNADEKFSKTYNTTGYPPATYFVVVQSPGPDGKFGVGLQTSGAYTGQVINTATGNLIFNFTGTGSVHDAAAAQQLSDAINKQGNDDVYTKLSFQLMDPATAPAGKVVATAASQAALPQATQSPLPFEVTASAIAIGGLCVARYVRRS